MSSAESYMWSSWVLSCNVWKLSFEWKAEKSFIQSPESHLRTTDKTLILYFVVLWGPGSHSTKLRVWHRQNNDLWIMRLFLHAQMCLWCVYKAHVPLCVFSWIANTLRPQWSERHLHFVQSQPLDAYKHLWSTVLLPLQDLFATVYETAARIEMTS